jgi:hypothetical protein
MRRPALSVLLLFLFAMPLAGNLPKPQRRPGLREAEKRMNAPMDPPVIFPRRAANPAQLMDEAEELAELSAGIPARIERVNRGQLPKELNEELRRIEKLAKRLRTEMAP